MAEEIPVQGRARPQIASVVGTAIAASGFWLALLLLGSSVPLGLLELGISVALSMLAVAHFSGAPNPISQGLRGAGAGLAGGTALFGLAAITDAGALILLVPAVTLGLGAAVADPGDGGSRQIAWRLIASGLAGIFIVVTGVMLLGVWAFLAPLLPLPVMRLADRQVEGRAV